MVLFRDKESAACASGWVLATVLGIKALMGSKYKKQLERSKNVGRRLAKENIALLNLACDGIGISNGWENHIRPIDSIEVHKFRMCKSVNDAERALFQELAYYLSREDDDNCTLYNIGEILFGFYKIGKDTPIEDQLENAKQNVEFIKQAAYDRANPFLEGISDESLIKGAVLLENDVYWALNRGGAEK